MAASVDINCGFSETAWSYLGNQYTCSVTNLRLESANESIGGIIGVHSIGKSHDDVTALDIVIQINLKSIKSISKEDLKPFTMLKALYITDGGQFDLGGKILLFLTSAQNIFIFQLHVPKGYWPECKINSARQC